MFVTELALDETPSSHDCLKFSLFFTVIYYGQYYLLTILIWVCRSGSVYWKGLLLANVPHVLRVWTSNCVFNILPHLLLFWTLYGSGSGLSLSDSVFLTSMPLILLHSECWCFYCTCRMWFCWSTFSLGWFSWLSHLSWALYKRQQVQIICLRLVPFSRVRCFCIDHTWHFSNQSNVNTSKRALQEA